MAEKQFQARVRHLPTGKLVPVHPSFLNDPLWLSENNYVIVQPLKKFEQPPVSAVELPPVELPELDLTSKTKKK